MTEDAPDVLAEEEIRLRYAASVESSDDAIIAKSDGVILAWNAAAERLFGYTEHEAIGQPITMSSLRTCTRRSTRFWGAFELRDRKV